MARAGVKSSFVRCACSEYSFDSNEAFKFSESIDSPFYNKISALAKRNHFGVLRSH